MIASRIQQISSMGLFDSLPAPTKAGGTATLGKRDADSAGGPGDSNKKARQLDSSGSGGGAEGSAQQSSAGSAASRLWAGSLQAAFSEDKGSRITMEDVAVINHQAAPASAAGCRLAFFGIFDGHGGSNVARYAADHLHGCVLAAGLQQEAERLAEAASSSSVAASGGSSEAAALQPQVKQCKAAIAEGFKELDKRVLELCAANGWQDGCTAVAAWVLGNLVLVANVGDARCILARRPQAAAAPPAAAADQPRGAAAGSKPDAQQAAEQAPSSSEAPQAGSPEQPAAGQAATNDDQQQQQQQRAAQPKGLQAEQQQEQGKERLEPLKAITLTREHKAIFPQERQRIEKAGSFVSGDGRLAGRIEVSRAFGDRQFKKLGMSAAPDIQAFQLSPRDAFLLLACDGFWGVFGPQDAVDFAQRELLTKGRGVKQTCNRLIFEAIRERSCRDNCTVMLVALDDDVVGS